MPCSAAFIPRSRRPEAHILTLLLVRECRPRHRLRPLPHPSIRTPHPSLKTSHVTTPPTGSWPSLDACRSNPIYLSLAFSSPASGIVCTLELVRRRQRTPPPFQARSSHPDTPGAVALPL
jgi:hypothetical protein